MNKETFLSTVEELANSIKNDMIRNSKEFVDSGAMELNDFEDESFIPAMIFVTAFMNNYKNHYHL